MQELEHREIRQFVQSHTASKWQGWDSEPERLAPKSQLWSVGQFSQWSVVHGGLEAKWTRDPNSLGSSALLSCPHWWRYKDWRKGLGEGKSFFLSLRCPKDGHPLLGQQGDGPFYSSKGANIQNENSCSSRGIPLTSPRRWGEEKLSGLGRYLLWHPSATPSQQAPHQEGTPGTFNSSVCFSPFKTREPCHHTSHVTINMVQPSVQWQGKFTPNVSAKYIYVNLVLKAVKNPVRSQSRLKVPDQVPSTKTGKQSRPPGSTPHLPTASLYFSQNREAGKERVLV